MLLVYDNPANWADVTEEQMQGLYAEYAAVSQDPATVHSAQLSPIDTAKTIRVKNGETMTTDGPFAETKEHLGGYYLVEADSIDAAAKIAARIPSARLGGSVEVRPIIEM
ncbi:MAG TPA: YciI family protein [Gaiellaceae bacterium]